jgi:hypothetical protein
MVVAAKNSTEVITQGDDSLKVIYKVGDKVLKETNYIFGQEFSDPDPAGNVWKVTYYCHGIFTAHFSTVYNYL